MDLLKNEIIIKEFKYEKFDIVDFYDIKIHIDSIKDINKGWKIEMNQIGKLNYQKYKNEKIIKIGVLGNANVGKSFILSKLAKMVFPSGASIKTEGLSIKYPDIELFQDRKIVLLDSGSLETPFLASDEAHNDIKSNIFIEKSRDKHYTELFLQNYIINNSDILIVILDCLTFSEQKLLIKIKREMDRAYLTIPLYIIHNLKSFITKKQVEDYIENYLLKSTTFTLEKGHCISTSTKIDNSKIFFYEKLTDKNKNKTKERKIYHLIYANQNSEAGQYYNQSTLNFIEKSYQTLVDLQGFDIIDSIKKRFISFSKYIIDNEEKITKESFDDSVPNVIKLKSENEIILKKCLIDELGFSIIKTNNYEPKYNVYKKDDKIILKLEISGNCIIKSKIVLSGEYNIIEISGEKKLDKEPEKSYDNIYNTREYGKFNLDIPLILEEFPLANEIPEIRESKGVYILEYKLAKKYETKEYENKDDNI